MQDTLTGTEIGSYILGEQLAEGGMGAVYQATLPGSTEQWAIKLIVPHDDDEEIRQRFKREITLMQSLRHPNIIPVCASGTQKGIMYFVMPLVRGPSLFDLLTRRRFTPLTAWQILDPVAQALDYAHKRGVIHRDIKPGNILVEPKVSDGQRSNHIYLVDFGLSKATDASTLTKPGYSIGTPHYMAPEQVLARPLTPQADIYSLGIVVYEMLLGRLPFYARKIQEIAFKHVHDKAPAPGTLRPDFPKPLELVILRTMAKDPADRFRTAGEFSMAYAQAVEVLDPTARKIDYWVNVPQV
jgi:serine/threonine protein kinase